MKVFISWSGDRSHRVALLLDQWLECVIQVLDPWVSSKDIDRGSLWFSEINDQLSSTTVGIVCLTRENKDKPWILFESGALAKGLSSNRVCTFLVDLKSTDLKDPLAQFNHTLPDKNGVWGLVRTINSSLGDIALKPDILERVFETYWPQFDKTFKEIIKDTPDKEPEIKRDENDILLELLSTVRNMDRRIRSVEGAQTEKINPPKSSVSEIKNMGVYTAIRKMRIDEGKAPDDIEKVINDSYKRKVNKSNLTSLIEAIDKGQGIPVSFITGIFEGA